MSQAAKKVHQSRSAKTRDKLLNALEDLLKEKDFGEIGVAEIAARAGVSPASIYRRFDKKQGFIAVLFELYLQRLNEWVSSPEAQVDIEGLPLRAALRLVARQAWRQLEAQVHLLRAIHLHGRQHLDLMGDKGDLYEAGMLSAMRGIIAYYADEVKRTDHDKAARMLAYYFNNIFMERGLFRDQSGEWAKALADDTFCDEIGDFAYGYLQTPDTADED